jgi:predicted RNase H-like HicB family nuclease
MRSYIALISKDPDSAWGVHFPDLPGCTSAGDTMQDAIANAGKALRLWAEDEPELPEPSALDRLRRRADVRADLDAGATAVVIPLIVADRKQRYNVMLDPALVEGIDHAARTAGVSRSDFLANAAMESLEGKIGAVAVRRGRKAVGSSKNKKRA